MRRLGKALLWLIGGVLLLLVLAVGSVVALLTSESGTRWLAEQAERHAPVDLSIERVEGTLFTELTIHGLFLSLPDGPRIELDEGRLGIDARAGLRGELRIPVVHATGLLIDLPPEAIDDDEEPFELPDAIRLPLAVQLEDVLLSDLRVYREGEPLVTITQIAAQARASGALIELQHLALDMPEIQARLQARIETEGDYAVNAEGTWTAPLPDAVAEGLDTNEAQGRLELDGHLRERLRLHHVLSAGVDLTLQAEVANALEDPRFDVEATWTPFAYRLAPDQTAHVATGRLRASGEPDDWSLGLDGGARLDEMPAVELVLQAHGDLSMAEIETLRLDSGAGRLTLAGPIRFDEALGWDLQLALDDLDPTPLGLEMDAGLERLRADLQGHLPLDTEQTPLAALEAAIDIHELRGHFEDHALTGQLGLTLADGTARLRESQLNVDEDALTAALSGQVAGLDGDLADPGHALDLEMDLALAAPDLARLQEELEGHLEQLRIAVSGRYTPASGQLQARLYLAPLRAESHGIGVTGDGRVDLTESGARIDRLRLAMDDGGALDLAGDVGWAKGLDWDLALQAEALDPAIITPEAPGRLDLTLTTRGRQAEDGVLQLQAELERLTGTLREQPVEGHGRAELEGDALTVEQLELALGANTLSAQGRWTEALDFRLRVDAPELHQLWPDLAGRLNLDAHVTGSPEAPQIAAEGDGAGLRLGDIALARLQLNAEAGLAEDAPARLDLRLENLEPATGIQLASVRLGATGTIDDHRLDLDVDGQDLGTLTLALAGGFDLDTTHWSGRLARLDLTQPQAGDWSLPAPVALEGGPESARLERLCLTRDGGRICAEGRWQEASGGDFSALLEDLELGWLEPLLPPELGIEGQINAEASGRLDDQGRIDADLAVRPTDGRLMVRDEDGELQDVPYRDAHLNARVRDRDVDVDFRLGFLDGGIARATLELRPDGDDMRIDGDLEARLDDLSWIAAASPDIQRLRGVLDARLTFGGRLVAPLVEGAVRFTDGGVLIPDAGIDILIPEVTANVVSAEEMTLDGRLESGDGAIDLAGRVDLGDDGPRAEMQLRGEDFLAVNRVDAEATITPDLELVFTPEDGIRVRGEVLLPWARIRPPDLPPGAIRVSGDEIILGEELEEAQALKTDIRIRIRLGDDVRFDGHGLTARFAGEVDVEEIAGRPTQLFGEIRIPEGRFNAYGQDLRVDRGILLFQGPAETPELDLRAVRTVREYNVTVGLEIGGTPDNLRSRVFSEPAMDETEAMAFLLTGRPLSGASESDGNMIASAAAAYGLEQSALITQRIGTELGLDEVTIDTEGGIEESALTLGLYLSPRLLLRYSVGLFDNTSRVLLSYELSRRLTLETSSGTTEQTVDLIYRIER
ncbi:MULTISPECIES: translocation/assembly module TamB domain-containing protein [unclassified Thioalkalivibrio]|uniref:translocation/assembly module TamB domain-containing protein n=1 Tax=unclassified Thioalkalivibrio TaxID=2621013 RepID=UPI0003624C14|nr:MULTISPECIES: translocation/assembly module TamB domain-containing protein [unclassified Thioalkalivibrio]